MTRNAWPLALGLLVAVACSPAAPAASPAAKPAAATSAPAGASAPAATTAPAAAAPRAPMKVKVGQVPGTPSSGIYLALDRGYFAEEGFEVELEPFDAGERSIPALATGQIEISGSGLSAGLYG